MKDARFRVRISDDHWMVCIALNAEASKLINNKAAALRPIEKSPRDRYEEAADILAKTESFYKLMNRHSIREPRI
jgi:hypothetical protein